MKKIFNLLGFNNIDIKILRLIVKHKILSFIDIEHKLVLQQPQVSRSVKKLFHKGYITKKYRKKCNGRQETLIVFNHKEYDKITNDIEKYLGSIIRSSERFYLYHGKYV